MFLWFKAFHIISVVAWMAGLFYLPRLFVYHEQVQPGSEASELFKVMERRLLRAIMNPALVASWVFGFLTLWSIDFSDLREGWFHLKLALVVVLTGFHMLLGRYRKDFEVDKRGRGDRFYRVLNEVPTVLLIGIIILVVVRPW